ncbi:YybH family protein [Pontibacter silvestris]|uniref:YybH family protein n=1 Tax=Pontibacter silvestris TaxID=2305183 RepID=A0ABW4WXP9_9BACT|nr:nuclear transport factor 2 family protein [Pontibacter silvestris]MCC9138488.1 nuclear transport factor 2 family protein [Pontibacter silvestris]
MNIQNGKTAAESLITSYAKALSSADAASIPTFYTEDGRFLPNGFRALTSADLSKRSKSYLEKGQFHIEFNVQDIAIDGQFAFVEAVAQTRSVDVATGGALTHVSRDFFVLRKEQEEWKIFRYTFNNVKEQ